MKIEEVKELKNEVIREYLRRINIIFGDNDFSELPIVIKGQPYLFKMAFFNEKKENYPNLFEKLSDEEQEKIFKWTPEKGIFVYYLTINKINSNYIVIQELDTYLCDNIKDFSSVSFDFLESIKKVDINNFSILVKER